MKTSLQFKKYLSKKKIIHCILIPIALITFTTQHATQKREGIHAQKLMKIGDGLFPPLIGELRPLKTQMMTTARTMTTITDTTGTIRLRLR